MAQWEYRVITVCRDWAVDEQGKNRDYKDWVARFNTNAQRPRGPAERRGLDVILGFEGRQGWELVSIVPMALETSRTAMLVENMQLVFKRPLGR